MYLTFDIGTTALKTALVSPDGRVLSVHTSEYAPTTPRPDWMEMPPESYWLSAVEGTCAVLRESGSDASDLKAIGFSSQGQTFIPIDRNGKTLHDAIVWVDNRAQEIADEWAQEWLSREEYQRISGYPWIPAGLTVFKVAWLARHAPEAHRAWKFLCLPDYLIYRLTGETATDHVTARMSGFFNLQTNDWEPRLVAAGGITREQLPTVLAPGEIAGYVHTRASQELGIPVGIPVCVGANDQLVSAIGANNVKASIITETTGTALAVIATTNNLLDDNRICVGRHAVPDKFYAMTFAITSAIVLKWFRDLCAPGERYDSFIKGVGNIPPGCDGLTVLPHFAGTGSPTFNPNARGAFVGLSLQHTRSHISRAIMESCACMLQECLDPIREHGVEADCVRSLGGAARSDVWLQMKADLLGLPVERPRCSDAASLGAAMLAATGTGQFPSIVHVSETWYRPSQWFEPDPQKYPVYREVYARYRECYSKLYGIDP
ncbi:MAG: hypothetical protein COS85_14750 [Armatimonadetes bacterium CG07_land_8_20_14_0_80_59_28]|nr:MAG: hypothetical protein COS85_14750 [Armatimonadetes bacterium CG07_land_8_20_14_0_80_59_28]